MTPFGFDDPRRLLTRRMLVGSLAMVVIAIVAAVVGLIVFAQHASTVLRVCFGAAGFFLGLQAITNFATYAFGDDIQSRIRSDRLPRRRLRNWPPELFEMEDRVSLAKVSAFDFRSRLRPVLRDLAAQRLEARWNIDLAHQPSAAREHVLDPLWDELEDAPSDGRDQRFVRGPSTAKIQELIDDLEAI